MRQTPSWSARNPSPGPPGYRPIRGPRGPRHSARIAVLLPLLLTVASACRDPWLPSDFRPPDGPRTDQFVIRLLTVADAPADYEAVMESRDIIHRALLGGPWPPADFTVGEDRRQIARKERLARRKRSFTYAVLSPTGDRILGSVYVNRGIDGPDAAVFLWVRRSAHERGLDSVLERTTRAWIRSAWPFKWVVFPGRSLAVQSDSLPRVGGTLDPLKYR